MTLHLGGTLGQGIFFLFIVFFFLNHIFLCIGSRCLFQKFSKVGQVSPCFKKVGTSDDWEGTFFKIHGRLVIKFNTIFIASFLHIKAQLFIISINVAATQLSKNSTKESILSICRLSEYDDRKLLCHSFRFSILLCCCTLSMLCQSQVSVGHGILFVVL